MLNVMTVCRNNKSLNVLYLNISKAYTGSKQRNYVNVFFCLLRMTCAGQGLLVPSSWAEEDPEDILQSVITCIDQAVENLRGLNIDPQDIKGGWQGSDLRYNYRICLSL